MKKKGISLITLIITIVVIIILAAVVILSLGKNNPISQAKVASLVTEFESLQENFQMGKIQGIINENENGNKSGTLLLILGENNEIVKKHNEKFLVNEGILYSIPDKMNAQELEASDKVGIKRLYEEVIEISTAEELRQISQNVINGETYLNKKILLLNDIDLGATFDESGNLTSGTAFEPIGYYNGTYVKEVSSNAFMGVFDGNNKTISGMYILKDKAGSGSGDDGICNGLFGYIGNTAIVKNIIVKNSYVKGWQETAIIVGRSYGIIENCIVDGSCVILSNNTDVASIVGRNLGTVTKCKNYADVTGNSWFGGIVGTNCLTGKTSIIPIIMDCENYGSVTASGGSVGGIVSSNNWGKIINCNNYGEVLAKNGFTVGGISGSTGANSAIVNCENSGKVLSEKGSKTGGIVGASGANSSILNCKNTGEVIGNYVQVGGIVGVTEGKTSVENCKNTGVIKAYNLSKGITLGLGGIVGWLTSASNVKSCENIGEVIAPNTGFCVGGIVGGAWEDSNISYSINKGNVSYSIVDANSSQIGGIAGALCSRSNIDTCINLGTVSGHQHIGGILGQVGYLGKGIIKNCYNLGTLKCTSTSFSNAGGIVGITYVDNGYTANGNTQVINCYNAGKIEVETLTDTLGTVVGCIKNNSEIKNNISLNGYIENGNQVNYAIQIPLIGKIRDANTTSESNNQFLDLADMKLDTAINILNTDLTDDVYELDTKNINNGLPILKRFNYNM